MLCRVGTVHTTDLIVVAVLPVIALKRYCDVVLHELRSLVESQRNGSAASATEPESQDLFLSSSKTPSARELGPEPHTLQMHEQ